MNLAADLILFFIVLLCAFWGYKKGFALSCYNFLGGIISIILDIFFSKPFADYISNSILNPFFEKHFTNAFQKFLNERAAADTNSEVFSSAVDFFQKHGLAQDELQRFFDNAGNDTQKFIDSAISAVSRSVSDFAGTIIAWVVLFFVFLFLCRFVFKFFDLLSKLPILNFANRSFGLLFGICHGLFLAVLFSLALFYSEPFLQKSDISFLSDFAVDKTYLIKLFSIFF